MKKKIMIRMTIQAILAIIAFLGLFYGAIYMTVAIASNM